MKRFFATMAMIMAVVNVAHAAIIVDVVEEASNSFKIYVNGELNGTASTRAGAQKIANGWGKDGTINWKTGSAGATPNVGATTKASPTPPSGQKALSAAPEQKLLKAAPEQKLLPQNAASSTSKAVATTPKSAASTPKLLPEKAASSASGAAKAGPKAAGTATKAAAGVAGTALTVGLGVISVVDGANNVTQSVKTSEEKTSWGDVGRGALGGAEVTGGAAMIVNAIPVGGQVAYGASIAVGTVIGAAGAGTKMFSQTDCDRDPVTGQYACCNVVKNMSNLKGARYCNIGDEMFAGFPYVRTCMQGKNKAESNWFVARFLDDHWSDTAEEKFCKGYSMPAAGNYNIQPIASSEAAGKVCWKWECADANMKRQGNKCVVDAPACKEEEVTCLDNQTKMGATKCYRKCLANGKGATTMIVSCKNGTKPAEPNDGWKLNGKPLYAKCVAKQNQSTAAVAAFNQTSVTNPDTQSTPESDVNSTNVPDTGADVKPAFKCDDAKLVQLSGWRGKYAEYSDIVAASDNLINACNESKIENQTMFDMRYAELSEMIARADAEIAAAAAAAAEKAARQNSEKRITDAVQQLQGLTGGLKTSVWKTADGNFNGARLASDSVAGVVLGTAGGLITSSVVKKNQIKNGFEDLKCTIGGQLVADYGDAFTVGVK